jgi:hypothetical protein
MQPRSHEVTKKRIRSSRNPRGRAQTAMTRTYIQVILLEALLIAALWIFGRLFA